MSNAATTASRIDLRLQCEQNSVSHGGNMKPTEFRSGDTAPQAGPYEELNVFGTRTGQVIVMTRGESFPATSRGFSWRPLSTRSVAELRERASEYRAMAGTATTEKVRHALLKLADRFDALAATRESGDPTL